MNKDKTLISVIVPVYKVEKYIEKCIQSILKQTYKNLQIILVDDGSPDSCGKICDEYAKKDSRIEVIHKANGGLSSARNAALDIAKGDYIGFVDSDDYISEDMFEYLYNLLQEHKADVSMCNFYVVTSGEAIPKNNVNEIKEYDKISILKEILLDKHIQSYAWNKLYKKSLFDGIRYPLGKNYEDLGTTFYILENANKIVVGGDSKYYYLLREDSIVNNVIEKTVLDYIDIISTRYDYVENSYGNTELQKYNIYYLVKTSITAYNDVNNLKPISEELNRKINILYKKSKQLILEHKHEVIDLFDETQKLQLSDILGIDFSDI